MMRIRNPLNMLGELRGYLLGVGLVLCMVATAVVFLPQPQKANAFAGRAERTGYFFNKTDLTNGDKVIYNANVGLTGVNSVDSFINGIKFLLQNTTTDSPMSPTGNTSNRTGAAFIILDMLGYPPGTTIATADTEFSRWEAAIRRVNSNADIPINWNQPYTYTINTFWQNDGNGTTGDIAWYNNAFANAQTADSIVIPWTDGRLYAIKIDCANPVSNDNRPWGVPNYLAAKHVDENGALMTSGNFGNNIVCPGPGTCTPVNRSGNSYSITLGTNGYRVSNFSSAVGYTYTGYSLYQNDSFIASSTGTATAVDFNIGGTVPKFTIFWRYQRSLGNNCKDIVPPAVGIGETATLESTIATGNLWTPLDGFPTVLSSPTAQQFKLSYGTAGNYQVKLRVNSVDSICWVVVTQKPYIRAYGGDIFAGSSSGCYGEGWKLYGGNAGIYGFVGTTAGTGSGAQLGVLAMGEVWGFNSAMLRTGATAPLPPNGLTFGNESSPLGKIGISECPPDYWGKKTRTINNVINMGLGTIDLVNYTSGEYYADSARGTVVINMVDIPIGRVVNLYVEGDLLILGNIKYLGSGSWGSVSEIPRLQIVVRGNIYIDKSVTQLDGVYVAQGKTIYTCSNFNPDNIRTECNTQLTVNGALVATKIKWLRTFGHWLNSSASENPNSVSNCTSLGVTYTKPTCASEIVNLGPEAWMVEQSTANPTADYIQALPPLL